MMNFESVFFRDGLWNWADNSTSWSSTWIHGYEFDIDEKLTGIWSYCINIRNNITRRIVSEVGSQWERCASSGWYWEYLRDEDELWKALCLVNVGFWFCLLFLVLFEVKICSLWIWMLDLWKYIFFMNLFKMLSMFCFIFYSPYMLQNVQKLQTLNLLFITRWIKIFMDNLDIPQINNLKKETQTYFSQYVIFKIRVRDTKSHCVLVVKFFGKLSLVMGSTYVSAIFNICSNFY